MIPPMAAKNKILPPLGVVAPGVRLRQDAELTEDGASLFSFTPNSIIGGNAVCFASLPEWLRDTLTRIGTVSHCFSDGGGVTAFIRGVPGIHVFPIARPPWMQQEIDDGC